MPQVLIVSNRLPVNVAKSDGRLTFSSSTGGVATGLASYVTSRNNRWIGWPGIASDDLTESDKQQIVNELDSYHCTPVFLSQKQIDGFYNGYSNSILWPLFHNLPYRDNDASQHRRWWQMYREVNKLYADIVLSETAENSHIWVHDYQLLLLPALLRAESLSTTIGFFLHIPFPGAKTLTKLAETRKLIDGVLGADLIGFHTPSYVAAFMENCQQLKLTVVDNQTIRVSERLVRVAGFPMGIDYEKYAQSSRSKLVKAAAKRYRQRYKGLKVIASVDRMDPSKGLIERLEAYRQFLSQNDSLRGTVVFAMIVAPSRSSVAAYKRLSNKLDKLVAAINSSYGTNDWQPVDYMNSAQPFEEVTGLFSIADVAFIAPLKDGMNLAAKEYVASAQQNGALILSQTAGAAEELRAALIVNPQQPESLVAALQQALTIPKPELNVRMRKMQQYLQSHSVHNWAKDFVDSLQKPIPGTPTLTKNLRGSSELQLVDDYERAEKRLLLLDYDGSLVPIRQDYRQAKPPRAVYDTLAALAADKCNDVVIISGREADDLDSWFGGLPINLVAEHGASVRLAGDSRWRMVEGIETRWKRTIRPILEKYTELTPGARVESKPHSLVWHYREATPYYAQKYLVTLKRVLRPYLNKYGVKFYQGHKILEIKNPKITKDRAARRWLRQSHDFILAIGDDYTDEDIFAILPTTSYTLKVGRGLTKANYRLASPQTVQKLLRELSTTSK